MLDGKFGNDNQRKGIVVDEQVSNTRHAEIIAKLIAQKPSRTIPQLGELPANRGLEDRTAAEYARDRAIAKAARAKRAGKRPAGRSRPITSGDSSVGREAAGF